MKDIVIATSNKNKVKEYQTLLEPLGYNVKSLFDYDPIEIDENGNSYEENALIKADALYAHTHIACIADDSGLEIRAFDNKPGIHSARWHSELDYKDKNLLVIDLLKNVSDRSAKFTCVIAYVDDNYRKTFKGELYGQIAKEPRGTNGFGYDPIFEPNCCDGLTNAELLPEKKNEISHRGQATRLFLDFLRGNHDN